MSRYQSNLENNQASANHGLRVHLNGHNYIDLRMIGSIDIIAHSTGHDPTETMLADKEMRGKIRNIAFLDALYRSDAVESWIKGNAGAINRGEKGFTTSILLDQNVRARRPPTANN